MRQRLVIGNWKMHGSRASVETLTGAVLEGLCGMSENALAGLQVAVCPPFPYIGLVGGLLQARGAGTIAPEVAPVIAIGAQDVSAEAAAEAARTGDVSAAMLRDMGVTYAIIGHSERRQLLGETDALVAAKFIAAQSGRLRPVLCIGETLEQREAGRTNEVVLSQLQAVADAAGKDALCRAVIAYEPVWAIGSGRTATPEQAQAVHAEVRALLCSLDAEAGRQTPILYGGSVKAANAGALFECSDIDGGLVGGASLQAEEFIGICRGV